MSCDRKIEKVPVSQSNLDLLRVHICSEERHLPGEEYNETTVAGGHNGRTRRGLSRGDGVAAGNWPNAPVCARACRRRWTAPACGPVASAATAWRVLAGIDSARLNELSQARTGARERAWLARAEVTGRRLPPARAAGRDLDYVVLDLDATLVEVHSEKEQASPHFKGGFGYHPCAP